MEQQDVMKIAFVGAAGGLTALLINSTMENPMLSKDGQKVAVGIILVSALYLGYQYIVGPQHVTTGTEISRQLSTPVQVK